MKLKYIAEFDDDFIGIYSSTSYELQVKSKGIKYYTGTIKDNVVIVFSEYNPANNFVDVEEENIHDNLEGAIESLIRLTKNKINYAERYLIKGVFLH